MACGAEGGFARIGSRNPNPRFGVGEEWSGGFRGGRGVWVQNGMVGGLGLAAVGGF